MNLILQSIHEAEPGPKWQRLFHYFWPAYQEWFLSEGHRARPSYLRSEQALQQAMPELLPIYRRLCALAGGGDLAARFLSLYCPPPYLAGCSQAIWSRDLPTLIRNYDYSPDLFEGVLLYTNWLRPVIAMSDCLWGVLDGINDSGLAVSLAFGGRKLTGVGFGIPLVLRYVLEVCSTTAEAVAVLQRVPVHMAYNVTVVDSSGEHATLYLAPDQAPVLTAATTCTNHQRTIEWADYARMTKTVERKHYLEKHLTDPAENKQDFLARFLASPLHHTDYRRGFGTLYTAVYEPAVGAVTLHWRERKALRQSFRRFREERTHIRLQPRAALFK